MTKKSDKDRDIFTDGITYAALMGNGIKTSSPPPNAPFTRVAEKKRTEYEDQSFITQFTASTVLNLAAKIDADDKNNAALIGLISQSFGLENDPNHTQFRTLQNDLKTLGHKIVRNSVDYRNFDGASALKAVEIGEPILGKNAYNSQMLELIGKHESGGDYNRVYAGKGIKRVDLTNMTIDEVMTWQKEYTSVEGSASSAAGKYQIIRKTLAGLKEDMGLTGEEKFDQAMQDKMAMRLLDQRGYSALLEGRISEAKFVNNVSNEWASLKNTSGRGAYDGDGLNAGAVSAATTISAARLDKQLITTASNEMPAPAPVI